MKKQTSELNQKYTLLWMSLLFILLSLSSVSSVQAANAPAHPADTNNDFVINADEATLYGKCFKDFCTWPTGPNPVPADYATNAGKIFRSELQTYYYDSQLSAPSWKPWYFLLLKPDGTNIPNGSTVSGTITASAILVA